MEAKFWNIAELVNDHGQWLSQLRGKEKQEWKPKPNLLCNAGQEAVSGACLKAGSNGKELGGFTGSPALLLLPDWAIYLFEYC